MTEAPKPRFISLIGYPAVGKSTLAEQLRSEGFTIISGDAICREMKDALGIATLGECYELHRAEIDAQVDLQLQEALSKRKNIAFDALNISVPRRSRNLDLVKNAGGYNLEAVVIYPPEEEEHADRLVRRVFFENRTRASNAMFQARLEAEYQPPTHQEGYDVIRYVGVPPKNPLIRM